MRIVIDLQGYQSRAQENTEASRFILEFTKAIIRNRGQHDIFLALNGLLQSTISAIRAEFNALLPQGNIRVWYAVGPVSYTNPDNNQRRHVAELTREAFLAQFKPDLVLISDLFVGADNDGVTSIGLNCVTPTVIFLFDLLPLRYQQPYVGAPAMEAWYLNKLCQLHRCNRVLATTEILGQDEAGYLNIPLEKRITISIEDTLDHCALKAIQSFETLHLAQSSAKKNPSYRPKLAFLSPLPPARSGISFYSAELLPALSLYYDIDVIVAEAEISDPWINEHCKIRSVEWFSSIGNNYYERVLYHFGNSVFHQHMFKLLDEIPGIVVLHDFFLADIYYHIELVCGKKNFWTKELYHSHGYKAVQELFHVNDIRTIIATYPNSLSILQKSLMTIVHSESSMRLSQLFYGSSENSVVIPLLRESAKEITALERLEIRQQLNLGKDDFVVCSFGILGATKQNHCLLKAWLSSTLAGDKNCVLVFVGELNDVDYEQQIQKIISENTIDTRIHITGWVDTQHFKAYLASADVAVQLRRKSRGETSAAVLDCMNHGIATIVNANGSMADLPDHCVIKLPDEFTNSDLVYALDRLRTDKNYRSQLGSLAREFIKSHHAPEICAKQYFDAIENCYARGTSNLTTLVRSIMQAQPSKVESGTLLRLSQALDKTIAPTYCRRQLFLDISILVQTDLKTGIERVVRSILSEWLQNPPQGFRVEPIYATASDCYRYARSFTLNFLGCPSDILADEPIDYHAGDIYLGLDLAHHLVITKSNFYQELRRQGVQVKFLMYDLLPLQLAYAFPSAINEMHQKWLDVVVQNDEAICISKTVANDLYKMLEQYPKKQTSSFKISWFHLGADIENSAPSTGIPKNADQILRQLKANTTFLMVGTIEPRKGHAQTLAAFEHLWASNDNSILVIIGKQGWMVGTLIDKLKNHPELGQRLFWVEGASDEYVAKIYAASTCLIAASEGEGFGLPLIEAAQHKLAIIARDIEVFREVAAEHAYYFKGTTPLELATAIKTWLSLFANGQTPKSESMPWLTWEESAKQLATVLG